MSSGDSSGASIGSRSGWLVPEDDVAVREVLRLRELQVAAVADRLEQRPPLAEDDGNHDDLVSVDQARLRELRHDAAAAEDDEVGSGSGLQLLDLGGEIA